MKIIKPIHAHCDVPCGIYETDTLKHSAQTCLALVNKLLGLKAEADDLELHNQRLRLTWHKEEHAQQCKQQLYILWSDYFKADHFQQHPKLQQTLWLAAKQCSAVKQTVSRSAVESLLTLVEQVDHYFQAVKTPLK